MQELDAYTIKNLFVKLKIDHGLSDTALNRIHQKLKQVLREAVNLDLIMRNPCDKVKPPRPTKPTMNYLDHQGVSRLLAALEIQEGQPESRTRSEGTVAVFQRSLGMAVRLALGTGMRRGEVLGLTWGNTDLDKGVVKVVQQLTSKDGIRNTKTERSRRVLALDELTLNHLRLWKKEQAAYLLSLGINQGSETPVVTDELGNFKEPTNFSRWWRDFCKTHDFVGLKFHDLRSTQATLLLADGMDIKTVQHRLGHEKASTTLDLYASAILGKDHEAATMIGSILAQKPKPLGEVINL